MGAIASQITRLTIVYPTVYSGASQRKPQISASLAFVRGIRRWPVNSPHKWPVARKMFSFDDVIMRVKYVMLLFGRWMYALLLHQSVFQVNATGPWLVMLGADSFSVMKYNILGIYYEPNSTVAILGHMADSNPPPSTNLSAVYVSNSTSANISIGSTVEDLQLNNASALPNLQPLIIRGNRNVYKFTHYRFWRWLLFFWKSFSEL